MAQDKSRTKPKKKKPTGFVGKNIRRVQIGSKGVKIVKSYVYPLVVLAFVAFAAFLGVTPQKDENG